MEDFLRDALTIKWWIGVVLVGLLLNILGSYVIKFIDHLRSKISKSSKIKNEKSLAARKKKIEFYLANPEERLFLAIEELRWRIRSIIFIFFGFLFLYMYNSFYTSGYFMNHFPMVWRSFTVLAFALCFLLVATSNHNATKISSLLEDVQKKMKDD